MTCYRENAKPLEIEDYIGKRIKIFIYSGTLNRWWGTLIGVNHPTESRPFWKFIIKDKDNDDRDELVFISIHHSFGLHETKE